MTEIPHDRVSLDDDEFVDRLAQEYGKVSGLDPFISGNFPEYIIDGTSTADLAETYNTSLSEWIVQTHRAMPRILEVLRKSIDAAEAADAEKDDLIASIVKEARLGFD